MAITENFKKISTVSHISKNSFYFYMFFSYSSNWFVALCLLIKFDIIEFQKKSQHAIRAYHEWDKTVVCGQCLLCTITPVIPINLVLSVYHSNYFLHEWIILCTGLLWTICFIASLNYLLQGKFSVIQVILYCVDWKHNLHYHTFISKAHWISLKLSSWVLT